MGILTNLYGDIGAQVEGGKFTRPGGHALYRDLIFKLEQNYGQLRDSDKGPCGQLALLRFRTEKVIQKLNFQFNKFVFI